MTLASVRQVALPAGLTIRPLALSDYDHGFLELLATVAPMGDTHTDIAQGMTRSEFERVFRRMAGGGDGGDDAGDGGDNDQYHIVVVEHTASGRIVGTGTLFVEKKFIHECAYTGHIEDVVVAHGYRNANVGSRIIQSLAATAYAVKCYKAIVCAPPVNNARLRQLGFEWKGKHMAAVDGLRVGGDGVRAQHR